ncbi:MAG: hypothetical protein AB1Z98_07930 [Nannocystaceae bacterium]
MAMACSSIQYVPLEAGRYVVDELNTPEPFHGVTLDVDLDAGEATLRDGAAEFHLTLTRVPDREQWRGDCGTMSGHAMLEPAGVAPTTFTVRGEPVQFDTLHVGCGGGSVHLTQATHDDARWIFRRR